MNIEQLKRAKEIEQEIGFLEKHKKTLENIISFGEKGHKLEIRISAGGTFGSILLHDEAEIAETEIIKIEKRLKALEKEFDKL